jgi:phage terminase small subunit
VLVGIDVVEMAGGGKDGETNHMPMFTMKAKVADKNNALTLAMRHLGMLTDKLQHSGDQGAPIRQDVLIEIDWAAIEERVRKHCGD